jgi:hypothetical protein
MVAPLRLIFEPIRTVLVRTKELTVLYNRFGFGQIQAALRTGHYLFRNLPAILFGCAACAGCAQQAAQAQPKEYQSRHQNQKPHCRFPLLNIMIK